MFEQRFVVTAINCGGDVYVRCWGLMYEKLSNFVPLWCASADDWKHIEDELGVGHNAEFGGLQGVEVDGASDAEDVETPGEAWAALAHYRLTGERFCERS